MNPCIKRQTHIDAFVLGRCASARDLLVGLFGEQRGARGFAREAHQPEGLARGLALVPLAAPERAAPELQVVVA